MTIRIIKPKTIGDYTYSLYEDPNGISVGFLRDFGSFAYNVTKNLNIDTETSPGTYNVPYNHAFTVDMSFYTHNYDYHYDKTAKFAFGVSKVVDITGFTITYNGAKTLTIKRTLSATALDVYIGIEEIPDNLGGLKVNVVDETKSNYSDIEDTVVVDGGYELPVTHMVKTFYNCSNLSAIPNIPMYIRVLEKPFPEGLIGDFNVQTFSSAIEYLFLEVMSKTNIYFIDKTINHDSYHLKNICSQGKTIHYEDDDNPPPTLSYTITRVLGSGQTAEDNEGTWAYIKATSRIYNTYIPVGWLCSFDESATNLIVDGVAETVTWQRTSTTENKTTTVISEAWLNVGDSSSHVFELQIGDKVLDDNQAVRRQSRSQKMQAVLPSAFATIDFLKGGKGVAFGKFATQPGFWCEFDAHFKDVETESITCDDISSNGIITGYDVLNLKNNNYIRGGGGVLNEGIGFVDSYSDMIAYMKAYHERDSQDRLREGFNIGTSREVSGSTIWNSLRMLIDDDGNPTVFVGQPAAWRKALGIPLIDNGTADPGSTAANTYKDVSVTFSKTFADVPNVVVGFNSNSTAGAFGRCSCSVASITKTGCVLRFFNGDTVTRHPGIRWIAIGE